MTEGITKSFRQLFDGVLDIAYPPICLCCETFIERKNELICDRCWERAKQFDYPFCANCREVLEKNVTCPHCSDEHAIPVFALGHFTEPLKEIIHRMKYYGYRRLADDLAYRLLDLYTDKMKTLKLDTIVPIPLHSYREKNRGFNQAALLSDIIGRGLAVGVDHKSLLKIRRTKDQTRLNPQQREENIKGAFKVFGEELKNKRVMIVDDVITTGATIREAHKMLEEADAQVVAYCVTAVAG
jgi:competence protein ComFC